MLFFVQEILESLINFFDVFWYELQQKGLCARSLHGRCISCLLGGSAAVPLHLGGGYDMQDSQHLLFALSCYIMHESFILIGAI